jgi:hypothetical protein
MFKLIGTSLSIFSTLALSLPTPGHAQEKRVSLDGYGPARIGMTRKALEKALGTKLSKDDATEDAQSCEIAEPLNGSGGVAYMLIHGKLARVEVFSKGIRTVSGVQVNDSQASVIATYPGRIEVSPHFYTAPEGTYLTMFSKDKRKGIRFETDNGKVSAYYAGNAEVIQYVEGCQ